MAAVSLLWAPGTRAAGAPADLAVIVVSRLDGYQPAPQGTRPSGPLTDQELAQFAPGPTGRAVLAATYARSFLGGGQRRAVMIGLDLGTVSRARSYFGGAREGALDIGDVFPAAGIPHGFRVVVRPAKSPGASVQQVFVQSGPLVFIVTVSDVPASPVTDAQVTTVARAQAAAVPKQIADQEDASAAADVAREVGYALGFVLPVALVVAVVVFLRRRR